MKKMFIVYALLSVGIFVLGVIIARGNVMIMVDAPSLMLLLAPTVLMLLSHYGPKEFIRTFKTAMAKSNTGEHELKNALLFFSTAQKLIMASAVATAFLGIIMILDNVGRGNPETARTVAWWMAVDLISVLYAAMLLIVTTIPFKSAVQKRLNDLNK